MCLCGVVCVHKFQKLWLMWKMHLECAKCIQMNVAYISFFSAICLYVFGISPRFSGCGTSTAEIFARHHYKSKWCWWWNPTMVWKSVRTNEQAWQKRWRKKHVNEWVRSKRNLCPLARAICCEIFHTYLKFKFTFDVSNRRHSWVCSLSLPVSLSSLSPFVLRSSQKTVCITFDVRT